MQIIELIDKTILITGAGSGIGRETAVTASRVGATVVLLDISSEGLKETMSLLEGTNHCAHTIDLCKSEDVLPLIRQISEAHGKISGIVHCAGISSRKPLNMLTKDGFSKVMDINFYSFVELVREATKKRYFQDGGSVVVMSSISSIKGYKAKTEYCVSKASVDAFVRCMAAELAPRKIRINSVMAAEVLTPLALKARETSDAVGASGFSTPLGPSDPYEIANTICFLLSDATKTITGTSLLIDGGACIQ